MSDQKIFVISFLLALVQGFINGVKFLLNLIIMWPMYVIMLAANDLPTPLFVDYVLMISAELVYWFLLGRFLFHVW